MIITAVMVSGKMSICYGKVKTKTTQYMIDTLLRESVKPKQTCERWVFVVEETGQYFCIIDALCTRIVT